MALAVLELLFLCCIELFDADRVLELLVEVDRILDESDVMEVLRVRDAKAAHAVGMSPLLEVPIEGPSAPVRLVAADFAFVLHTEPMELVQPEGDGLSVPAQGQIQWVVQRSIILFIFVLFVVESPSAIFTCDLICHRTELFLLQFGSSLLHKLGLTLLHVTLGGFDHVQELLHHETHAELALGHSPAVVATGFRSVALALLGSFGQEILWNILLGDPLHAEKALSPVRETAAALHAQGFKALLEALEPQRLEVLGTVHAGHVHRALGRCVTRRGRFCACTPSAPARDCALLPRLLEGRRPFAGDGRKVDQGLGSLEERLEVVQQILEVLSVGCSHLGSRRNLGEVAEGGQVVQILGRAELLHVARPLVQGVKVKVLAEHFLPRKHRCAFHVCLQRQCLLRFDVREAHVVLPGLLQALIE
mmetsp:Transcript_13310/g.38709  ORF Transcript_13310/g.38709 Transcript_13310/m.38709 type:complete len:420 (-) Transcript_13310:287-1546(-)